MYIKIWLDDEKDPKKYGFDDYLWAKDFRDVMLLMKKHGEKITHFHLDHHLNDRFRTGFDTFQFILSEYIYDDELPNLVEIKSHMSDESMFQSYIDFYNDIIEDSEHEKSLIILHETVYIR